MHPASSALAISFECDLALPSEVEGYTGQSCSPRVACNHKQKLHDANDLSIFELIELELLAERTVKEEATKLGERQSTLNAEAIQPPLKMFKIGTAVSIGFPKVHVLLSPGNCTAPRPRFPPNRGYPYTVCVMGLHRSGTHAMVKYLNQFFDVHVEPTIAKKHKRHGSDCGTVSLPFDFHIWKHTVPLGCFGMHGIGSNGGPAIVLLMVRDVASWMESLSQHAYEIFPRCNGRKQKRKQGAVWWMFQDVEIRASKEDGFHNPFEGAHFDSLTTLWATYAAGYLSGAMKHPEGIGPTFVILRFEDLVLRPSEVIEELHSLGLPRNARTFAPIEESIEGSRGREGGRAKLVQHIAGVSHVLGEEDRARLRLQMGSHRMLLDLLGYTMS